MSLSPGQNPALSRASDYSKAVIPNFKVILTGEVGVGKTAIFSQIRHQDHVLSDVPSSQSQTLATLGVDTCSHTFATRHGNVTLTLWDTAGVERYRTLTRNYYRNTHAALLVFSLCDPASLFHLPRWQRDVVDSAPSAALYLVGNKSDLERQVADPAMASFASTHSCQAAFITSALKGEGLLSALTAVCEDLVSRYQRHPELTDHDKARSEGSVLHLQTSGNHDVTKRCC